MTKQVALVTGASSGMGKDIAKALLKDGHVVYVAARRVSRMEDLQALGAIPIKMDISVDDEIQAAVAQIEAEHRGVDILVNNAGYGNYGSVEETEIDDARYQFEVNLFGLARLTQLLLPHMRAQKAGKIVNISSMGGKIYTPLGAWYHATKHALEGWSDCLRLELKAFNIDVLIIEPGAIKTEFADVMVPPLLARSGQGPYAEVAHKLAQAVPKVYGSKLATDPVVVARLISKALRKKRPKTRYPVGFGARPGLFARKWLGDRVFDFLMLKAPL